MVFPQESLKLFLKTPRCLFSRPAMILPAMIFPQAGLATAFHVPKASFVTKNAPSLQSRDPRSRIRRAFSKREFIKGKPFTQLLLTFCPLFISPCKYLPCQAFVIQNVFSLHRQLEGEGSRFRPILSQSGLDCFALHAFDHDATKS